MEIFHTPNISVFCRNNLPVSACYPIVTSDNFFYGWLNLLSCIIVSLYIVVEFCHHYYDPWQGYKYVAKTDCTTQYTHT